MNSVFANAVRMVDLRKNWRVKILSALVRSEFEFGDSRLVENTDEEWYNRVLLKVTRAGNVAVGIKSEADLYSPRILGSLVGNKVTYFDVIRPFFARVGEDACRNGLSYHQKVIMRREGIHRHYEPLIVWYWVHGFEAAYFEARKALSRCLAIAAEQSPSVQADFFEGYLSALRKGSITNSLRFAGETTATPIHQFLLEYGFKCQERLYTITELHEILCHFYGSFVIGDKARLKKECDRLGFKIAGRGKPPRKRDIGELTLSLFREHFEAKALVDAETRRLKSNHAKTGLLKKGSC